MRIKYGLSSAFILDQSGSMSRKISSLREAAYGGTISADLEKTMEQILREQEQGSDTP